MPLLLDRFSGVDLGHVALGTSPTTARRVQLDGVAADAWLKDEGAFGDGRWGGNKVRKLEWIIPEAHRRRRDTLFTVGGIGTHWGLAAALYGREHGLRTVLGLVDQPIDDHVRDQQRRLRESGAELHVFGSVGRLKLAAPWLLGRMAVRSRGRLPYYLPAGGSSPVGALAYVDVALEIAAQVASGELPTPDEVVVPVGSGGTAAGLALGFALAGLPTRVFAVVVNDAFPLDAEVLARLANDTADLLRARGAAIDVRLAPSDLAASARWLGETYGAPTREGTEALELADHWGVPLEPVYTAKAIAALRERWSERSGTVLFLATHGPR